MKDLTVVIPVYHEKPEIVEDLYHDLKNMGAEVIVVDDGDTMNLKIPKLTYFPHMGYGYALKQGVEQATRPLICTMDGDGQHDPNDVWRLWTVYNLVKDCKMVVGCRWNLKESFIRRWGRKCINFFATCWANHLLLDLNSGMRIVNRELVIGYSPILCDTFSFTTSLTLSMVTDNHKVVWIPIDVRQRAYGKSHVKPFLHGLITLWYVLKIGGALRTRNLRSAIRSIWKRTGAVEPLVQKA